MRIGIKVGSKLLTDGKGGIKLLFIQKLCDQMAVLKKAGHELFLVSSGAIACDPNRGRTERQRASIGQHRLMAKYDFFMYEVHGIEVSQQLLTYHDLDEDGGTFLSDFKNDLLCDFIPIVNYNDAVDNKEIEALHEYADNDKLFLKLCVAVKAEVAIIVSHLDDFLDINQRPIHKATISQKDYLFSCCNGGNDLGRGKDGMKTKVDVLCSLASQGIKTILAPGLKEGFILRAINQENGFGLHIKLSK